MNAAHALLISMGFEWFGDQIHIDGIMLDFHKKKTAQGIFNLSHVQGRIEEESTRKQFLRFVNTILSEGLELQIETLGKEQFRGTFQFMF